MAKWISAQPHLIATRDAVICALPLVLVGSFFLLIAQPPSATLQAYVAPYVPTLLVPYRMLGGIISLWVAYGAAHALAKSYGLDASAAGLVATAAYLVAAFPAGAAAIPLTRLGPGGLFAALAIGLVSVELTRALERARLLLRMPESAPPVVVRAFSALVPCFASILAAFAIVHLLHVDLISLLETLARPLLTAADSFLGAASIVLVDSGLWLLGVHASAALAPIKPVWEAMLVQNMEAAVHGLPLPHVATPPFFLWFIWQGGSGAVLPLAFLLARAKSAQLRSVGRLGLVPAIFNVNEPILFGAPVVLNPSLALPFVFAPLASAASAYFAIRHGWVHAPYLEVPWTLPSPVGAFLSTGGDWRAVVLELGNFAGCLLLYWPFVRRYDLALCRAEAEGGSPVAAEARSVAE
jgi:PTS system cellobiose-specific IIC component